MGKRGNALPSAENFQRSSNCKAIRLNSALISKQPCWKQPFDGSEFAAILLPQGELPNRITCSLEMLPEKATKGSDTEAMSSDLTPGAAAPTP